MVRRQRPSFSRKDHRRIANSRPAPDLVSGNRVQSADDVNFKKAYYQKYAKALNDCLHGKWSGDKASKIPTQNLENSPLIDRSQTSVQLSAQSSSPNKPAAGLNFPRRGKNGTVAISSDRADGVDPTLEGNKEAIFEIDARIYTHEIGNILATKATVTKAKPFGDALAFGDPNGTGTAKDPDSGATLELCVFGSVP